MSYPSVKINWLERLAKSFAVHVAAETPSTAAVADECMNPLQLLMLENRRDPMKSLVVAVVVVVAAVGVVAAVAVQIKTGQLQGSLPLTKNLH